MADRPARVLFVISSLAGGGAEKLVALLLRHLDRRRFHPRLLLRRDRIDHPVPQGVEVECARAPRGVGGAARFLSRIARGLRTFQPHLVVSHLTFTNLLTALARGLQARGVRHVAWVHTGTERSKRLALHQRAWMQAQYRMGLRRADRVVCCSTGVRDDLCALVGLDRQRVAVIRNPVDAEGVEAAAQWRREHYRPDPAVLRLVHLGRFVEAKGHAVLIDALARLRERREAELTLIGEGPLRADVAARAEAAEVAGAVRFAGFLSPPYRELAGHDVFVFPSLWEGFPVALAEAMGLGLAVVASDCNHGPRELIDDGVHGFLVSVGDAAAVAQRVEALGADRALAERLGAAARERVLAELMPGRAARQFERLCEEVLEGV
ncbi:MAG: glycosyltransferase [Candidatus Brocadiia bacterium]